MPWRRFSHAARWKGQPAHTTTGAASTREGVKVPQTKGAPVRARRAADRGAEADISVIALVDGAVGSREQGAGRAEAGNPNHLDAYLLRTSLSYLGAIGIDRIAHRARAFGGTLLTALAELGLTVTTPVEPEARAGNICFTHPAASRLMALAAKDDILVWADSGRVRLSVHAFVDEDDISRFLDRLPEYLSKAS